MLNRKLSGMLAMTFVFTAQMLFSQILLQGTVFDNGAEYLGSGAEPVEGVLVTVTDQADAGTSFSGYSNEEGHYSLEIIATAVNDDPEAGPAGFRLHQNYPNPFNPSTVIMFELNSPAHVNLEIYNVMGQKVTTLIDGWKTESDQAIWNGTDDNGKGVPAGVYMYSLKAGGRSSYKKMLLLDGHHQTISSAGSAAPAIAQSSNGSLKKLLTTHYTVTVTGEDIAPYEQTDLTITSNMTMDITVTRTLTDIDGNSYTTVKIGDQWWTAENLKVTRYRNGETIPNVTDYSAWGGLSTGSLCANNNDETYVDTYGYLYNWYAVTDIRDIAPEGWHVPTDDEWKDLEMFLGMSESDADLDSEVRGTTEGSKLAGNDSLWDEGALTANAAFGESGFSALPAGYRDHAGDFLNREEHCNLWSFSIYSSDEAWLRSIDYEQSIVSRIAGDKRFGQSVRLVKGDPPQANPTVSGVCFAHYVDHNEMVNDVSVTFTGCGWGSFTTVTGTEYDGYYEQEVPLGWSGTVSAEKSGYTFSDSYTLSDASVMSS